jgi:hypothetical protein
MSTRFALISLFGSYLGSKGVYCVVMLFVIIYIDIFVNGNNLACVILAGDKIWNYFPCSRLFCAYPTESKYC